MEQLANVLPFIRAEKVETYALLTTTPLGRLAHQYVTERLRSGQIVRLTADANRCHLRSFVESFGNRPIDQLGHAAVQRWLEMLERKGYAAATRSVHMSTLRGFAKWCVLHKHVKTDWTIHAPKIRRSRQVPRDLTAAHFNLIIDAAPDSRARCALWLMFGSGLRCVEVSRLEVDDLDRASGFLFVTGKGGHQGFVPCPAPVLTAIDTYLAESGHTSGPLIRPVRGPIRPLSPSRISHFAIQAIRDAGVKIRKGDGRTAHGLRAAAASELYDTCRDPRIVQQFLRHAHLQTTSVYLRRAEQEQVRKAVEQRFVA